jgi:hypothetical protein
MKRIVLFVEGEGDAAAMPLLVAKILTEKNAWDAVKLDEHPFRVGQVNKLVKNDCREWRRKLSASIKRTDVGGVLLILDGDIKKVAGDPFCACTVAKSLSNAAVNVGAGSIFSVAIAFACREYESWLIASAKSLAGKTFPDGRTVPTDLKAPDGDLEAHRDAKGWLNEVIQGGHKPTRDQATVTRWLDPRLVRERPMRSFRRLESAVDELVTAIRYGEHVASPQASF